MPCWIVRVQETAGKVGHPGLDWHGSAVRLDAVQARQIVS